ncbi:hypothetical protein LTR94_024274 [Friedmanniomyces endolithicus]|nr:hypothetical protein LTR94_024274 [Friedmanniomyces endolithicus]
MQDLAVLAHRIEAHTPNDGTFETPISGVKLIRASLPTTPMPVIYEPTICFVAQGRKRAVLGHTVYIYDPAHFLIATVGMPVMGSVIEASPSAPYLCLQLDLDVKRMNEIAVRRPMASASQPGVCGLTLNATTPGLIDAACRLVGLLDTPDDIEALSPLIEQEIFYRLLTGASSEIVRQMCLSDSRLNQITRAILWLRSNFRQTCRIDQAAEVAGMSRSTFHLHFRAITAMSPIEFRTQLRLQEARRLMVSDALDAASAGFTVGYESPSHFSRDYARVFGMPPAADAAYGLCSPQWHWRRSRRVLGVVASLDFKDTLQGMRHTQPRRNVPIRTIVQPRLAKTAGEELRRPPPKTTTIAASTRFRKARSASARDTCTAK